MGNIVVELDNDRVPATANNFLQYADDKFYDNTVFHRVIKGFMIQGGGFEANQNEKPTRAPSPTRSEKVEVTPEAPSPWPDAPT